MRSSDWSSDVCCSDLVEAAVEADQDRPVVRQDLGEQAEDEQHQEDPGRPEAAAVAPEVLPAPAVDRADRDAEDARPAGRSGDRRDPHASRASKTIRRAATMYKTTPIRARLRPSRVKNIRVPNIPRYASPSTDPHT